MPFNPKKPNIITPNGHIRLLNSDDTAKLADYAKRNHAHLSPWEPARDAHYYEQEATFNRILLAEGDFYADKHVRLGAFCPSSQRMLASIDFSEIVRGPLQACFVGYSIDAKHQGQGLMQELMPPCLDYMFSQFNMHRIMATYTHQNLRSAALLERLGFEREGYAKSYLNIAGVWEDHVLSALINPNH